MPDPISRACHSDVACTLNAVMRDLQAEGLVSAAAQFRAAFVSGLDRGVCVQMLAASIETTPGIGRLHRRAVDDVRPADDFDGVLQFVCESN
jgi:hypothetical protein